MYNNIFIHSMAYTAFIDLLISTKIHILFSCFIIYYITIIVCIALNLVILNLIRLNQIYILLYTLFIYPIFYDYELIQYYNNL